MEILAECTWGDGPDVLVTLDDCRFFNLEPVKMAHSIHGICESGQLCFTAEEALYLADKLITAAQHAMALKAIDGP